MNFDVIRVIRNHVISRRTQYNLLVRNRCIKDKVLEICEVHQRDPYELFLDVGSGDGELLRLFSISFHEMVLSDIDAKSLKIAKSKLSNSSPVCCDAHALPFRDKVFSLISAFSLIEHLYQPLKFLKGASRVLKTEGLFIVQIPNSNFFIEMHTGVMLPALLPIALKEKIKERTFPGFYINWDITKSAATRYLGKLFLEVKSYKLNYPEKALTKSAKPLFKALSKMHLLNVCPMGYIICARFPKDQL